jgi:murein DD-endopeptidase MepM/ murein hydrolase activator NlpD
MARRLAFCFACTLVLAAPAAGGDIYHRKRAIDEHISTLNQKLAHARVQAGVLTQQISVVTAKIRLLQGDVTDAQTKLNVLESQLAMHERRLNVLNELFVLQTRKLNLLRRSYDIALKRVERRLIDSYETPGIDEVDVMLSATSMSNLLDGIEYMHQIETQDKQVSVELNRARAEMQATRERTRTTKHEAAVETAVVRARTEEQHAVAQALISTQQQLTSARSVKRESLASIKENEKEFLAETQNLQAESDALAAKIRAATSSSPPSGATDVTPSAAGLIWPVQGPITSPFGMRWGRMHTGIDIGAPTGTPIHAAAAGTVVYCGWMEGYGNLVAIDHHNSLSTAYAHQSQIGVSCGQDVAQGDVIGYVGCTGHCFGPHLHFEVRVNGVPVDPMGYL